METRMNKYYEEEEIPTSRTKKNEDLYKEINKNDIDNYEIKSNSTVLGETKAEIDVEKIKKILDTKYNEIPKRKSIRLEETNEEVEEKEITKEYDINVVLEKAKENKTENYEEERLKKIKNTQYDILNSLNVAKEEKEEKEIPKSEELESLINTIAFNEKNSKTNLDLDLLSDLKGSDDTEVLEGLKEDLDNVSEIKTEDKEEVKEKDESKEEKDDNEITLTNSFYTKSNSIANKDLEEDTNFAKDINNGNSFIKVAIVLISLIFAAGLVLLIKILFFS